MSTMNNISKLDSSLNLLRKLPRISLSNIKDNPGSSKKSKRGRGQHGGDKHGCGNKGSGQRQNFMRLGYETGNTPFYLRFGYEPYYKRHHLRRQYPPLSLLQLQKLIDTSRVDSRQPIDVTTICNTGLFRIIPQSHEFGFQLTDEGADMFKAKVNIEVQWTTEQVIAAIERNGGVITTAYYDPISLEALANPKKFFSKGAPVPKRMIPLEDAIAYYSDPVFRGYLADPGKISWEQLVLSQKYGYVPPDIKKDSDYEMLCMRKDPLQVFFGLEPGWLVNLTDKKIIKPVSKELKEFYERSIFCN